MSNTDMPTNTSILADMNVTISDIETLSGLNPNDVDLKRSVGQLKAARTSFLAHTQNTRLQGRWDTCTPEVKR